MHKIIFLLLILSLPLQALSQEKAAYLILDKNGKKADYGTILRMALQNQVVLFGELHNNPISHWLQFEMVRDLANDKTPLLVGMEMFEADDQTIIDEYFSGRISQRNFEQEARLWNNYKTDYKPVLEFARENAIPLIATNIPRRYASMVYSHGLESLGRLSPLARSWIAPLPIEVDLTLPGYARISEMAHGHGGDNLPHSQAVKDATMAHRILTNMSVDSRHIHLNGTYHSDNFEGIYWYLKKADPDLKIMTISTVEKDDIHGASANEDLRGRADFIIVVPSSMTKTY